MSVLPPILCYHKIDTRFELGFTRLGPRVFRRQVEALAKAGYQSLGSAGLLSHLTAGTAPGARLPVVFTFDDGYSGLAEHAFPVLVDHGFKALVFAITDFVGRENSWDVQYGWRKFFHLSWDQLARWQERGIEVHSHGTSHARLTWLPDDIVAAEMATSRDVIAARLGRAPTAFSYPFGATDPRVCGLAARAGYTLGFAGPNNGTRADPLCLERRAVYPWDPFAPPLVMRADLPGAIARGVAKVTNGCAVGTAAIQKALGRRY